MMAIMMTGFILQLGAAARVAQKAAHIAEIDPSGLTLTLVSVSVVFSALLILYGAYSITGRIFTKNASSSSKEAEEAAAVAVALDLHLGCKDSSEEEEAAAIALALEKFISENAVHDIESGIITIKR